jgi:hypothetical protein
MPEAVDRRVLGAVRFVDAVTRTEVNTPLVVGAEGVAWRRNSRGWFVVAEAPRLRHHTFAFDAAPTDVVLGAVPVELTVRDPGGTYLARRHTLTLPRSADPTRAGAADSLFRPVDVPMFRSPSTPVTPGWAVVRVTVTNRATGASLPGALLRVLSTAATQAVLATGLADARGEGVIVLPNVPVTTFGTGASVLATEITTTVEAVVLPGSRGVPDPDVIAAQANSAAARRVTLSNVRLASGRTVVASLSILV